jgi:hypothetical protein
MPPKTRKSRSTHTDRPLRNYTITAQSNGHGRQDGHQAPSAEDRADLAAVAAVEALGYRLAVQCVDCGHWLASPISVSAHRGPRCRTRHGGD